MPGMSTGLNTNNPVVVSAFRSALAHQALVVLAVLFLVAVAWSLARSAQLRQGQAARRAGSLRPDDPAPAEAAPPEPDARRLVRISFGLLWVFDGLLQAQASMPLGMAPQVIEPAAATSPGWVQHLDNTIATIWSYHPVAAPAAAVWIQVGIGLWLLAAPRGNWSRLGGLASAAWGLIVWAFGEAFGQIFAPGLSWLFGAPGAALLYCVAGALLALPESAWATGWLGKALLRLNGCFFLGMALLQAWPGRGFWQGQLRPRATPGTLTSMLQQMAQTPQPHVLSSWVASFASFDAAHGWAVNLFAVVALGAVGAAFVTAHPRAVQVGMVAGLALCLADWVLVQDLGFMGGVGTDPNSMLPMAALFVASWVAIVRAPAGERARAGYRLPVPATLAAGTAPAAGLSLAPQAAQPWRERLASNPAYAFRTVAALGALAITLVGAAPMAWAAASPNADPVLAQAVDGPPVATDSPAPPFSLVDQYGRGVSLASLHGKTLAVTFLDPVCTSDCPVIAQEFRAADRSLGAAARHVELVAIDANPRYTAPDYLVAFDSQEGLTSVRNWLYLTGALPQLQAVWRSFGELVAYSPGGAMIDHSEYAWVIDSRGHTRFVLDADPGPATEATQSSFSATLADSIKKALASL
jgi:cytochrome oxidase Cu insertion factor (SCO1/SenC/PrrC family)